MIQIKDGRKELYQWDTGVELLVDVECSQVHFANKVFGRSVDVEVVDGIAKIPDILLQNDKDLVVWGFVGTAENGYTRVSKIFKVNRRNKPEEYVFTPTDQITLESVIKRMDELEETVNPEVIKETVDEYLRENPPNDEAIKNAIDSALTDAKESGEFDGADGRGITKISIQEE